MLKFWRMGAIAALLLTGVASANDTSSMREEIADLRAKVAALESAEMAPAAGGDAASLTSMKKKGMITIGGGVETTIQVTNRDDERGTAGDNSTANGASDDDEILATRFVTTDASLKFKIAANKNSGLVIKLDIDDFLETDATDALESEDLLEEVYFYFKNIAGTGWGVNFGKKEVPYGMDIDKFLIGTPTNTDGAFAMLNPEADTNDGAPNAYDDVGNDEWGREQDNMFMIEPFFKYKDLLKLELAVFQNTDSGTDGEVGMHEDRSNDTLFFESYAVRVTVFPVEGLMLQASFMNQHCEENGDDEGQEEEDQYYSSLGVDYKFGNMPLELFAEWNHGWDTDYEDVRDSDLVVIGMIYGVTESVDFLLQGNWVNIDTDDTTVNNNAASNALDEDYYAIQAGIHYKLDTGMMLGLEYRHEWYDHDENNDNGVDDNYDQEGDTIAFGIKWKF